MEPHVKMTSLTNLESKCEVCDTIMNFWQFGSLGTVHLLILKAKNVQNRQKEEEGMVDTE